jgi:hypothetical protein
MVGFQIKIPNWLDMIFAWPVIVYRQWKYGYTFRKIYLDEGIYTIVDPEDYYHLKKFNWYLTGTSKKFYAHCNIKIGDIETKTVPMHRMLANAPKGLLVDHRNSNSLDNRKVNLRPATRSENQHNRQKRKNTSSKFKGVSFNKRLRKWNAYINTAGKRKNLGTFVLEIAAAKAYDEAARLYHGEFARLNFPGNTD